MVILYINIDKCHLNSTAIPGERVEKKGEKGRNSLNLPMSLDYCFGTTTFD